MRRPSLVMASVANDRRQVCRGSQRRDSTAVTDGLLPIVRLTSGAGGMALTYHRSPLTIYQGRGVRPLAVSARRARLLDRPQARNLTAHPPKEGIMTRLS